MTDREHEVLARIANALERLAAALEDPAPINVNIKEVDDSIEIGGHVTTGEDKA